MCHNHPVLLTYVDESYDRQRYWMVALVITEHHVRPLQRALDAVVRKAAESYPVDESAELHGHALLQAREDWAAMRTKEGDMVRARIGVYGDALKAIGAHDVQIIIRGLNLERYPSRAELPVSPHQRVLKDLLSCVNDQARAYGQWTLIIADEVDGATEHQQHFRLYQRDGIDGIGGNRLPEIVDTIHFAPSRASRLLQAADLVAYLYRRLASGQDSSPRARQTSERLWSYVAGRVVHEECEQHGPGDDQQGS